MTQKPDLVWKQSLSTTCGAASLMVALGGLEGQSLSAERELEIWRFANNASPHFPGSFPGRLALFALENGCRVEIHEDPKKLEAVFRLSTDQTRFPALDPEKALIEHRNYLEEAEKRDIPVHRGPLGLEKVADLAQNAQVLLLVSTAADVSGLHWVLLKHYDPLARTCVLMEPALGREFTGPLEIFLDHYARTHPFLGVAIALKSGRTI
jgi:hypothetical protein